MTKLSQCSKCIIGDGVHCEHYKPLTNDNCEHFYEKADNEIDMNHKVKIGILGLWIFCWFYGGRFLLIGTALLALVGCSIYGIVQYYKSNQYPYKEMRNLVIETLKQIGCQPEIDKENESHVNFMYQGENFIICIENDTMVAFYDTWWGSLDLNDPNIDNLKEAINLTNLGNLSKVAYSIYQEDNKLAVHTMYRLFLKKEIPDLPDLFKAILANFFEAQKEVKGRFNQLNNEKIEMNRKERVKVKGSQ